MPNAAASFDVCSGVTTLEPLVKEGARALSATQVPLPDWLTAPQAYRPTGDRDGFIEQSILTITSVLRHFRLDDGRRGRLSPSAPAKLVGGFVLILLVSLSRNYLFSLILLACVLVRFALLPSKTLRRAMGLATAAAGLSFIIMLPAILLGQQHSALLIATKVFDSVGIAMCVALTTPFNEMTAALRTFHVPNLFILTIDLALKNIVSLGQVALEVLTALHLRSVGCNRDKQSAIGGIGGVVFLKSHGAAEDMFAAMTCRGFDGEYVRPCDHQWRRADLLLLAALAAMTCLFAYMQVVL